MRKLPCVRDTVVRLRSSSPAAGRSRPYRWPTRAFASRTRRTPHTRGPACDTALAKYVSTRRAGGKVGTGKPLLDRTERSGVVVTMASGTEGLGGWAVEWTRSLSPWPFGLKSDCASIRLLCFCRKTEALS